MVHFGVISRSLEECVGGLVSSLLVPRADPLLTAGTRAAQLQNQWHTTQFSTSTLTIQHIYLALNQLAYHLITSQ